MHILLTFLLLYFITPFLPAGEPGGGLGLLLGAGCVVAFAFPAVIRVTAAARRRPPGTLLLAVAALSAALGVWALNRSLYNFESLPPVGENVFYAEGPDRVELVEKTGDGPEDRRVLFSTPKRFWLIKTFAINALLFVTALSVALLVGMQVEKPSHIFAIIVLGAVMDLWSVTAGVTEQVASSPLGAYFFLFNWPLAGQGGVTYPLIGATDFLFVGLFLFLARRFEFPVKRNIVGMAVALGLSIFSALVLGRGVPALPFIGLAVFLVNFRAILPDRKEALQIAAGAAVILALFALLWRLRG